MSLSPDTLLTLLAANTGAETAYVEDDDDDDDEGIDAFEFDDDDDDDEGFYDESDDAERRRRRFSRLRIRTGRRSRDFGQGTVGAKGGVINTRRGRIRFSFKQPVATERQLKTSLARVQTSVNRNASAIKRLNKSTASRLRSVSKSMAKERRRTRLAIRRNNKKMAAKIKAAEQNSLFLALMLGGGLGGDDGDDNTMLLLVLMMSGGLGGSGGNDNNMMMLVLMLALMGD